jgi:hypothetical protein
MWTVAVRKALDGVTSFLAHVAEHIAAQVGALLAEIASRFLDRKRASAVRDQALGTVSVR